uniref:Uncharacterized protein n=1 Tax=Amphora coffeiformis TaxID=265554 RepID=A0A7S3LAX5_9STRA|mmetsp:Transcript_14826/g.28241  ORF Transcript_14826/g.28241 Transcript_14826/m.28241 type:complete len:264 (-) Transcript_14826:176-967(-)|eukprot:scaffold8828_cov204-Amphora_coffeaeformis.AAC.34
MRNLLIRMFEFPPEDASEEELIHVNNNDCHLVTVPSSKNRDVAKAATAVSTTTATIATVVYDKHGMTPLHVACRKGQSSRVRNLIRQGANVNLVDASGRTPLMYACRNLHSYLVRFLLEHGADANVCTTHKNGQKRITALEVACRSNNVGAVRVLLEHGANVEEIEAPGKETLLHKACRRSNPEVVRLLLKYGGANANAALLSDGSTPLHQAVYRGNLQVVKCLVEQGATVQRANHHGVTPLHVAYTMQHYDVAEYLLESILL